MLPSSMYKNICIVIFTYSKGIFLSVRAFHAMLWRGRKHNPNKEIKALGERDDEQWGTRRSIFPAIYR
jgi:hypothetical protein